MKNLLFLTVFGFILPLIPTVAESKNSTVMQAESLLVPDKHIVSPLKISSTDKTSHDTYEAQIEAIRLLSKTKDSKYVAKYIQYLDYPSSPVLDQLCSPRMGESIENKMRDMKSVWPAFAAIMDTPHSEKILKAFVLDDNKPLDWRLTVLVVLKFKNFDDFNECIGVLLHNYPPGSSMTKMLKVLQMPNVGFWGVIDVPSLEKVATRF